MGRLGFRSSWCISRVVHVVSTSPQARKASISHHHDHLHLLTTTPTTHAVLTNDVRSSDWKTIVCQKTIVNHLCIVCVRTCELFTTLRSSYAGTGEFPDAVPSGHAWVMSHESCMTHDPHHEHARAHNAAHNGRVSHYVARTFACSQCDFASGWGASAPHKLTLLACECCYFFIFVRIVLVVFDCKCLWCVLSSVVVAVLVPRTVWTLRFIASAV